MKTSSARKEPCYSDVIYLAGSRPRPQLRGEYVPKGYSHNRTPPELQVANVIDQRQRPTAPYLTVAKVHLACTHSRLGSCFYFITAACRVIAFPVSLLLIWIPWWDSLIPRAISGALCEPIDLSVYPGGDWMPLDAKTGHSG